MNNLNSKINPKFELNIALIGNKILVTNFLNNLSNINNFSLKSKNVNNLEIANFYGNVKIKYEKEYISFDNQKKSILINFRKQKNDELKENNEIYVNLKLFTTGQNYYRYTKRNLVTPSIDDKTNGVLYLIDSILDKKNINHFKETYYLNSDIIKKYNLNVFIILNRFKNVENNNNINILVKNDIIEIINKKKDIEPFISELNFPIDYDDEFELNNNNLNNNDENNQLENKKNFDKFIDYFLSTLFDFKKINPLYTKEKIIILGKIDNLIDFIKNIYNESENVSYFYLKKLLIERFIMKYYFLFDINQIIYLINLFFQIEYFKFDILKNLSNIKIILILINDKNIKEEKNKISKIFNDYIKWTKNKNPENIVKLIFLLDKKNEKITEDLKNNVYNIIKYVNAYINFNYDFDYIDFNNDNFEDKILNIIKNKDINNSKNN